MLGKKTNVLLKLSTVLLDLKETFFTLLGTNDNWLKVKKKKVTINLVTKDHLNARTSLPLVIYQERKPKSFFVKLM